MKIDIKKSQCGAICNPMLENRYDARIVNRFVGVIDMYFVRSKMFNEIVVKIWGLE